MEVWESAIFDEKTSLKHISLPQVAEVMSMACYGCSALEEVVIPEGTTKIGGQAFYECRALTDVYCRAGVPPLLGIQVFEGTSIKNLYVPEGSADAYREAEGGVCLNISRSGVLIAERPKRKKTAGQRFGCPAAFCEICRRTSVLCEGKTDRVGKKRYSIGRMRISVMSVSSRDSRSMSVFSSTSP
ncbi:MAG: leucine-rich repeat protein [Alistipes putredinis]